MTKFEKMKYLHRHSRKASGAETARKKDPKKRIAAKNTGKKNAAQTSGTPEEEKKGAADEGRGGDPAEDVQG